MKHPYQHILLNKAGTLLFATAANSVFVFDVSGDEADAKLVGKWTDDIDPYYSARKHHKQILEKFEKEEKENADHISKKQKTAKKPKMPIPGPGAPPSFSYIRGLQLSRDDRYILILTDNDKATVVFQIDDPANVLKLVKRQPFPKRPCAVTTSLDDKNILVADKFGDVYCVGLLDTNILDEDKMEPLLGHVSMLTCVDSAVDEKGNQCVITSDRDEHIRVSYYPKGYLIKKWLFGHTEFVSKFILPTWGHGKVLLSAGGDNFVCSWLWQEKQGHEIVSKIPVDDIVESYLGDKHLAPKKFQNETKDLKEFCVSDILPLDVSERIVFIFERMNAMFVFNLTENGVLKYEKTIETDGDIISATAAGNKLIVSQQSDEKPIAIYDVSDNGDITLSGNIIANSGEEVKDAKDVVPVFTVGQLRKRREH